MLPQLAIVGGLVAFAAACLFVVKSAGRSDEIADRRVVMIEGDQPTVPLEGVQRGGAGVSARRLRPPAGDGSGRVADGGMVAAVLH